MNKTKLKKFLNKLDGKETPKEIGDLNFNISKLKTKLKDDINEKQVKPLIDRLDNLKKEFNN